VVHGFLTFNQYLDRTVSPVGVVILKVGLTTDLSVDVLQMIWIDLSIKLYFASGFQLEA